MYANREGMHNNLIDEPDNDYSSPEVRYSGENHNQSVLMFEACVSPRKFVKRLALAFEILLKP